MPGDAVVLVPALARPHRVEPLQESLRSSRDSFDLHLVYVLSPDDTEQLRAVSAAGITHLVMGHPPTRGDYAAKINLGVKSTEQEWILLAADDLKFWPGWADEAIRQALDTGCQVIGTNDLGNAEVKRGTHSTHTLVHRDYVERGTVDDPSCLLHEGYHHNWVDAEFIQTAKARGQFTFARQAIVEHLHPHWRKSEMDETYKRGLARYEEDRRLYKRREHLWRNLGSQTPHSGVSLVRR